MNRERFLSELDDTASPWDVLVIGGGATGLGTAVESAARGYRTLLVERADFASATSSRSTKLVHGGVRYLRQGDVPLVRESLRERGRLLRNAAHLVRPLPFLIPSYRWWETSFYGIGLKLYDRLAGRLGIEHTRLVSREDALERIATLNPQALRGGVLYFDAQFDDARLALTLAQTVADKGGVALNYVSVTRLLRESGRIRGAMLRDGESGNEWEIRAKIVINATGIFTDDIRRMDDDACPPLMTVSQGIHLVLDRRFLPGTTALMIPSTVDGRVLFAIPWEDRVLLGTTDTPRPKPERDPHALPEEIEYLLEHAARYLSPAPRREDVRSVFAGLRPLVSPGKQVRTARISRSHYLTVSDSDLVTITGGKWTTYRQMAEDTVDRAAQVGGLPPKPSMTRDMPLHGHTDAPPATPHLRVYGAAAAELEKLATGTDADPLHGRLPWRGAEVRWAVRREMARTLEDVLARRTRVLFTDAAAATEMAPKVAAIMAEELGQDAAWQASQLDAFNQLARHCRI